MFQLALWKCGNIFKESRINANDKNKDKTLKSVSTCNPIRRRLVNKPEQGISTRNGKLAVCDHEVLRKHTEIRSLSPEWRLLSKFSFDMVYMYADDTLIYYIGDSVNEVIFKFNKALEKLVTWCKQIS